ncbi:putative transposable element [Pseudoloma neurophilia]|uniref:Putative transposable element n=1 Tax=Pseudoloma neurophilia TaxID=146866 RepID=A0A0R0LRB0_9MICR|nr:putative transposable element [Pseudoloma neurophilia]
MSMTNPSSPSLLPFSDMASPTGSNITPFNGKEDEDITLWLKEIAMCSKVLGWNEEVERRAIIMNLRGEARSWVAEYLNGAGYDIETKLLVHELRQRFQGKGKTDITLTSFIHFKPPKSREELRKLLIFASKLADKAMMSTEALAQIIIMKVPEALRPFLSMPWKLNSPGRDLFTERKQFVGSHFPIQP